MTALKTTRRFRLHEDEEDGLLAGVDFQTHYLGNKDVFLHGDDIDNVVRDIYSQYLSNDDLKSSTLLAITVGAHQLEFFNVSRNETEFCIELPNIKSVQSGVTKRNKYPNAVVIETCVPGASTKVHVLHCMNQRNAKKIYNTINKAFEYYMPDSVTGMEFETCRLRKKEVLPTQKESRRKIEFKAETSVNGNGNRTIDMSFVDSGISQLRPKAEQNLKNQDSPADVLRSKSKSIQGKGVEGLGLLDNVDPEEEFDDEFTDFARSRTTSETFKWFGR